MMHSLKSLDVHLYEGNKCTDCSLVSFNILMWENVLIGLDYGSSILKYMEKIYNFTISILNDTKLQSVHLLPS
jgi:hypothetical protein